MPSLGKTIFELGRIFRKLNEKFFDGQLETPIIAVQTKGKVNAYGWFTLKKVWKDEKKEKEYYEITITAEYLTRTNEEIAGTMLHEMVHLYCCQNGIKDVSRNGTYHNTRYKTAAEEHGLTVGHDEKYGWTITTLTLDAESYVTKEIKINRQAFNIVRQGEQTKEKGKKKKQSMRKYICPECGMTVRATKEVNVICGECLKPMEVEGGDESGELDELKAASR